MNAVELLQYIKQHRVGIIATQSPSGNPQAALVGIAVTDSLELIFDTVKSSRKWQNLKHNPSAAVVIGGWDNTEITVQFEGIANEPEGTELEQLREIYFRTYPDGRERLKWADITHFCIKPTWIRYSNFASEEIVEFRKEELIAGFPLLRK